jgi:hypothetical protein
MENLIDTKSKTKLMLFFLTQPERDFFIGEIKKKNKGKSLGQDLVQLSRKEVLIAHSKRGKKYYSLNKHGKFYGQLKNWAKKLKAASEDELSRLAKKLSGLRLLVLSGFLTGQTALQCDILLVGKFRQKSINNFIAKAQKLVGNEINFAIMPSSEFEYRQNTFDRFMKDIFENEHLVLVDKSPRRAAKMFKSESLALKIK